jgi:hypothetical protein
LVLVQKDIEKRTEHELVAEIQHKIIARRKLARSVWDSGKAGENFKRLPIVTESLITDYEEVV